MMKFPQIILIAALLAIFLAAFCAYPAFAAEVEQEIKNRLENEEFQSLSDAVVNSGSPSVNSLDITDLIAKAVSGNLDLSPASVMNSILSDLFGEIGSLAGLMRNMVLIAIVSAMFKTLSASLKQKDAAEMGFFAAYAVITIILISSFSICAGVLQDMVGELCDIMYAAIPAMMSLMFMSGSVAGAYALNPLLLFVTNFIAAFTRDWIIVIISAAAGLELVNYISDKDILSKLAEITKKGVGWLMKGAAVLFIAILSLQGISAPILNNGVTKSAKAVVNVVPVVGQALSGAIDTVSAWSGVVRSGTLIVLIIILLLLCAAPVIKLLAFIIILKVTAGVIQPISDSRIVNAIDCVGSYVSLLLGAGALVITVFVFSVMVTLSV